MNRRWRAKDVAPIGGQQEQFEHVIKHLYAPEECWHQVVGNFGNARQRACEAGCALPVLLADHPVANQAGARCREHVLADHDALLAPAYMAALAASEQAGRFGRSAVEGAWLFVGNDGVTVVVRHGASQAQPHVMTAYRPVPIHGGRTPEDFCRTAVRKLRDKTSWKSGG